MRLLSKNLYLVLLFLVLLISSEQGAALESNMLSPYSNNYEDAENAAQTSYLKSLIHYQHIREAEAATDAPLLEEGSGLSTNSCVLSNGKFFCALGVDEQFSFLWPQTSVGEEQRGRCFGNTAAATRLCLSDCTWSQVNCSASDSLVQILQSLNVASVDALIESFMFITEMDREPEIFSEVYLINQILLRALANASSPFQEDFLTACSTLLDQRYRESSIQSISESVRYQAGTLLLQTMDMFGISTFTGNTAMTENIVLIKYNGSVGSEQMTKTIARNGQLVTIEPQEDISQALILLYANMTGYLPEQRTNFSSDVKLATPIVSLNIICDDQRCTPTTNRNQQFSITFHHNNYVVAELSLNYSVETMCVHWELPERALPSNNEDSFVTGYWSSEKGQKNRELSNVTHTVCVFTQSGVFAALLTEVNTSVLSDEDLRILTWIYAFGAAFSLLALAIIIAIFIGFRSLWSMSSGVHANLCVASALVILSFAVREERADNVPLCTTFAVLKHYFLTVALMWVLEDGIVLLLLSTVDKFKHKNRYYILGFTLLAYSAPLLYMCISVPIGFVLWTSELWGYGERNVCFLRLEPTMFYLTYLAPVAVMLVVDVILLSVTALLKLNQRSTVEAPQNRRPSISSLCIHSLTLMYFSLTWITVVFTDSRPLVYLSVLLISLQGVLLFILYVLLSKKARENIGHCSTQTIVQCKHVFVLKRFKESTRQTERPSSFVYESTCIKYGSEVHVNPVFEDKADDILTDIPTISPHRQLRTNVSDVSLWKIAHKASRMPSRLNIQPTIEEIEERATVVTFL